MSTAHSVLEMGIHVVTKFTGSAGEHIVDESVENQNEKFDLCSNLARRETQMTTFMKNTKTTPPLICLPGKESVHHFTSRSYNVHSSCFVLCYSLVPILA